MLEFLARPYTNDNTLRKAFKQSLAFGFFVFLFLWFFHPFELNSLKEALWKVAAVFGLITFAIMLLLNALVPLVFPGFFLEEKWTLGKELAYSLTHIFLIGLANFLYFGLFLQDHFSFTTLLWFQLVTLGVGIFPVGFLLIWKEARDARRYQLDSDKINQKGLDSPKQEELKLFFPSQNAGEDLHLGAGQFLFLQAADNYVEVYFKKDGILNKRLIRNTLKNLSESLEEHPFLLRCHKSYLVNLNQVIKLSGNAQGFRLHLKESDQSIPVSRAYNDFIKKHFTNRPK